MRLWWWWWAEVKVEVDGDGDGDGEGGLVSELVSESDDEGGNETPGPGTAARAGSIFGEMG